MDKKITKLDKNKTNFLIYNIIFISILFTMLIVFLFANLLPSKFLNVLFWIWGSLAFLYLLSVLIILLSLKKQTKETIKSKYAFDRLQTIEEVKTTFKDCILQEVEFKEDGFVFNGELINYNDVNIEYSIYGDNIMMHIYLKELEDTNPLLIFIVEEELYFCCKKFNLNIEKLDNEINMLNMNYKK